MLSHKTCTFNNYYVTAQSCSVLPMLSLNIFGNNTHNIEKSYSPEVSTQTQCTEKTNSLIGNC